MSVLRFLWNLLLAILLVVSSVLVLGTALGLVATRTWETKGLDDGVPSSTWLWLEGEPIYYQDQGERDGPCVVLVHGHSLEGSKTWEKNVTAPVRRGLRVVTVDLRGYGRSERAAEPVYSVRQQAELLAAVLNNLQVAGATVVTHDLASAVALQMALDQPQFVDRIVLIAPLLERPAEPLWDWALKVPHLRRAALWARWGGGPALGLERKAQFVNRDLVTSEYLQLVRDATHVAGTSAALEAMVTTPADDDLPEGLTDLNVPVLVLLGDGDSVVTAESAATWLEALPTAEVVTIERAGHYPHYEQSAAVNQRLIEFASSSAPLGE
ncbi:MAG: alpha/beta hydrolase [Chloroflexi bacterium]|nr:alpha/beta hydrolase [Chloroflexota bacterium]